MASVSTMLGRLIATILVSAPVVAADFRTLDIGAQCDSVPAREQARGSVAIPWGEVSGADVYAFKARDYDRDLVLMYFCPKGSLFSGNYFFPVEKLEKAVTSFHNAYDLLVSVYGAPFIDNTPWQAGESTKDERFVSAEPRKYMASWRTPRLHVAMSIMPSHASEGPGWRVFVVISRIQK